MKKDNNYNLLALSFKQGFISPNLPIVTFHQGEKEINFIIDTGSDENIINKESLKDLSYKMLEVAEEDKRSLNGLGGCQETEQCSISFGSDDGKYSETFLVADLAGPFESIRKQHCMVLHGMLGSNFLRRNNMTLDFKNLVVYNKE